jgi:2-C-methyl-D-erythritol 4-phosphate cytidylyltransferase
MTAAQEKTAFVIVVAGGQGVRMNAPVRKQYLPLAGGMVLTHTIQRFDRCPQIRQIVVVVPETDLDFCRRELIDPVHWKTTLILTAGGPTRQISVRNGLRMLPPTDGVVLVHDGVRPLVPAGLIAACIQEAERSGACVPAVPADDTLKRVDAEGWVRSGVDRENLWRIQTPQGFRLELLRRAHEAADRQRIQGTDDGSLVERLGHPVRVIPGSKRNFKLTTTEDVEIAEALLRAEPPNG